MVTGKQHPKSLVVAGSQPRQEGGLVEVCSPKKAATKINAITTQSFIIYAVRLSSITVRAANENSLERECPGFALPFAP
jgi:hypothetical protein